MCIVIIYWVFMYMQPIAIIFLLYLWYLCQGCIEIDNNQTVVVHAPKDSHTYRASASHGITKQDQKFTFTSVFDENASQKKFFDETMLGTVKNFIDGQNCLVFTYGVTNSGKTYTIQGEAQCWPFCMAKTLDSRLFASLFYIKQITNSIIVNKNVARDATDNAGRH